MMHFLKVQTLIRFTTNAKPLLATQFNNSSAIIESKKLCSKYGVNIDEVV